MLKKLLKYDLKSINIVLIVFYGLSIFFSLLTRIFLNIDNSFICNVIGQICNGTMIAMMFNIIINNMIRLWVRFKQNFYGDESYLTHTLPIPKKTLYLSKFITSVITLLISFIVIVISLFIAHYSKENIELVKNLLMPLATIYESTTISIIISFVFILFLEILNMLQSGYLGIVLGHKKNNLKMVYTFVFGFITYLMTQIFALAVVFISALFNKDLMNLFYSLETLNVDMIKMFVCMAAGVYFVSIFVLYIIISKQFSKGVNVD